MVEFKQLALSENEAKLIELLSEHQLEEKQIPSESNSDFSLALYDDGHYLGGVTANKWMNITHISLLALVNSARGKGYGTQLLKKAEAFAAKKGAAIITIHTQDYQAKTFYEQFGYSVFGKLDDVPFEGTTKFYLMKKI
ncbi:GNAT family N-acetyltransferase [Enterococcus wangshanyuanii]|uniref:N-acetyltransferase n=1 Tax=Enterococcus wangshanyuanii TaxID=2005703 RepID=A0ABQ1NI01_9ENTE|nr:GNAT family N-acetyltransferase [Enterococcus wangshanyuanii]GGC77253.1 N-acetyltransferase [Enterococcus wangshanyuanii]